MTIYPIKAFQDNYIWAIHDGHHLLVIDPGDAQPVLDFCQRYQLVLSTILITHHHHDHTGGIEALKRQFPNALVIGPNNPTISAIDQVVGEGDTITVNHPSVSFNVWAIPGHTLDHLAYIGELGLFCGDTLFHAGCGRLFEGSPQQMLHSLSRLAQLPSQTKVYCTHEYTQANLAFAQAVEPNNGEVSLTVAEVQALRVDDRPTLPSTIAEQLRINPFLRCQQSSVQQAVAVWSKQAYRDELATFTSLRQWKDQF
ncbi:hydroxyacylglutathione hydrolase [Neiella marina]|uniref:Hydroxyacylglutathione hydrolase n=1 Tax=Neiella holothuriorum TaxID=2870530 RepID=A0ABS7EHA4_9GAMM|nr:hydroxyacylglutathione hydrolase [Neiella holothuriorum]MBW8191718.1 hydroxyacylglutathione hydrolase [Neiella holothuriorum]